MPEVANAAIGYGLNFGMGVGSPLTYQSVGQIFDLTAAEKTRGTADVTHYQSPDAYREFIPTLKEGGEWSMQLHYVPAVNEPLEDAFDSGEVTPFQVTTRSGIRIQFSGIITTLGRAFPIDDKMSRTFAVKVSGKEVRLAAMP